MISEEAVVVCLKLQSQISAAETEESHEKCQSG
jgi:hypothetical protein